MRHAEFFARRAGASLRLLAVHEPELIFGIDVVPAGYDPAEISKYARERLERELDEAAAAIGPGVDVQHYVLEGSARRRAGERRRERHRPARRGIAPVRPGAPRAARGCLDRARPVVSREHPRRAARG